jgi:hypothetical protein
MNTYWTRHPRNFGNEYQIGVATTAEDAAQYKAEGYERINRESALHAMSNRGDAATQIYATVYFNGHHVYDRFQTARDIRSGDFPRSNGGIPPYHWNSFHDPR